MHVAPLWALEGGVRVGSARGQRYRGAAGPNSRDRIMGNLLYWHQRNTIVNDEGMFFYPGRPEASFVVY